MSTGETRKGPPPIPAEANKIPPEQPKPSGTHEENLMLQFIDRYSHLSLEQLTAEEQRIKTKLRKALETKLAQIDTLYSPVLLGILSTEERKQREELFKKQLDEEIAQLGKKIAETQEGQALSFIKKQKERAKKTETERQQNQEAIRALEQHIANTNAYTTDTIDTGLPDEPFGEDNSEQYQSILVKRRPEEKTRKDIGLISKARKESERIGNTTLQQFAESLTLRDIDALRLLGVQTEAKVEGTPGMRGSKVTGSDNILQEIRVRLQMLQTEQQRYEDKQLQEQQKGLLGRAFGKLTSLFSGEAKAAQQAYRQTQQTLEQFNTLFAQKGISVDTMLQSFTKDNSLPTDNLEADTNARVEQSLQQQAKAFEASFGDLRTAEEIAQAKLQEEGTLPEDISETIDEEQTIKDARLLDPQEIELEEIEKISLTPDEKQIFDSLDFADKKIIQNIIQLLNSGKNEKAQLAIIMATETRAADEQDAYDKYTDRRFSIGLRNQILNRLKSKETIVTLNEEKDRRKEARAAAEASSQILENVLKENLKTPEGKRIAEKGNTIIQTAKIDSTPIPKTQQTLPLYGAILTKLLYRYNTIDGTNGEKIALLLGLQKKGNSYTKEKMQTKFSTQDKKPYWLFQELNTIPDIHATSLLELTKSYNNLTPKERADVDAAVLAKAQKNDEAFVKILRKYNDKRRSPNFVVKQILEGLDNVNPEDNKNNKISFEITPQERSYNRDESDGNEYEEAA
jgi:hypothetical protein